MILVEIRCRARGCGHLLAAVDAVPDDWSATMTIPACPRHGGARWTWPRMLKARRGGLPTQVTVGLRLAVEQLRPAIVEARRTGQTQTETV